MLLIDRPVTEMGWEGDDDACFSVARNWNGIGWPEDCNICRYQSVAIRRNRRCSAKTRTEKMKMMTTIWGQRTATTASTPREGLPIEAENRISGTKGANASRVGVLSAQEQSDVRHEVLSEIMASLLIPLGD